MNQAQQTTSTDHPARVIVDVDERGRVLLARFGLKGTQLVVDQLPDGGLVLHRAVALTPTEAGHYLNPEAVSALDRALREVEEGELSDARLRSDRH